MVTAPFQTSVGTSAIPITAEDEKRTALGIANLHATAIVYYSTDPGVTTSTGFPIFPKTVRDMNIGLGDDTTPGIFVISDTAATTIAITEQFRK